LSFVQGCLFSVFAAAIHSWRPSLYPQPEDAPCCSDRNPPNMIWLRIGTSGFVVNAVMNFRVR
jgi:hypothetical protein